jgi:hypothetical protein
VAGVLLVAQRFLAVRRCLSVSSLARDLLFAFCFVLGRWELLVHPEFSKGSHVMTSAQWASACPEATKGP